MSWRPLRRRRERAQLLERANALLRRRRLVQAAADEQLRRWAYLIELPWPTTTDWSNIPADDWTPTMWKIARLARAAVPLLRSDPAVRPTSLVTDLVSAAPVTELFRAWALDASETLGLPHIPTVPVVAGRAVPPEEVSGQIARAQRHSRTGEPIRPDLYARPAIITECVGDGEAIEKLARSIGEADRNSAMTVFAFEARAKASTYERRLNGSLQSEIPGFAGSLRFHDGYEGSRKHTFCVPYIPGTYFPASLISTLNPDVRQYFHIDHLLPAVPGEDLAELAPRIEQAVYAGSRRAMRAAGTAAQREIASGRAPLGPSRPRW